jgi:hypothetical protein
VTANGVEIENVRDVENENVRDVEIENVRDVEIENVRDVEIENVRDVEIDGGVETATATATAVGKRPVSERQRRGAKSCTARGTCPRAPW